MQLSKHKEDSSFNEESIPLWKFAANIPRVITRNTDIDTEGKKAWKYKARMRS